MTDAARQEQRRTVRPASADTVNAHAVEWAVHGQALVATVAGELTFSKARALSRELERRLTPDIGRVVLDISGVTSGQDAALLAGLLSVRTTLRRRAGRLTIVAAGQRLDHLVRVSALDDLLTIVPSIEHARVTPDLPAQPGPISRADDVAA